MAMPVTQLVSHHTQTLGRHALHNLEHNWYMRAQEHSAQRMKHKMYLCREFNRNVVGSVLDVL